jgi:folate-binding Fe-S cluster repair protein YgfZ
MKIPRKPTSFIFLDAFFKKPFMTMLSFLALFALICTIYRSSAFLLDSAISRSQRQFLSSSNNLDYEYIPPRNAEEGRALQKPALPSSYPAGTPAGLRGEAVRSAIRSSCIGWNFSMESPLKYGVVEVTGQSMEALTRFLNGKFTRQCAASDVSSFKEASFLNAKGRLVDRIGIAMPSSQTTSVAYLLTSPGHDSQDLFQVLDKFVFPFDQVQLRHRNNCVVFSLLSSKQKCMQECFDNYILQRLRDDGALSTESHYILPAINECLRIPLVDTSFIVMPTAGLPPCAGWGYTFCFWPHQEQPQANGPGSVGERLWRYLISEKCPEGPIEVGALEYETLRIECGQPAYNKEMTAKAHRLDTKAVDDVEESDASLTVTTPASPLELALEGTIDVDKGCYQGQEGIASILKNKRGPPRSLYQVVFPDETNIYDYQSEGEFASSGRMTQENLTRMPMPNDALYVLGSNEEIMVGPITSVAEPSGTGEPVTLALALIRRADSILSSMRQMGIEIPITDMTIGRSNEVSVLVPPPPLDPLDGLEVIVGGTFTMGTLRILPSRRGGNRKNLFSADDIPMFVKNLPSDEEMNDLVPLTKLNDDKQVSSSRTPIAVQDAVIEKGVEIDDVSLDEEDKALNQAIAEAEEAAKEAQRKAEKLEMLRRRAEEAMERRKQKKA